MMVVQLTEPTAEEGLVWVDLTNMVIRVYHSGEWYILGASYS